MQELYPKGLRGFSRANARTFLAEMAEAGHDPKHVSRAMVMEQAEEALMEECQAADGGYDMIKDHDEVYYDSAEDESEIAGDSIPTA